MATIVNKNLKEQVETQNTIDVYGYFFESEVKLFSYLASNKTQTDEFLNEMWNKYGKFANNGSSVLNYGYSISQLIKSELLNITDSFEGECLTDDCWSIVERIMRSIYVLSYVASQTPSSPGQYLAYHINTILGEDSYLSPSTDWPFYPFETKPDDLTLELNKFFMDMALELSNSKLSEVSILDVLGFGSMFHSFSKIPDIFSLFGDKKYSCSNSPWSLQLNMVIYNQMIKKFNLSWSDDWKPQLEDDCKDLVQQWGEYMKDPESNPFPPSVLNNTVFNYTKYIKKDMTTFLETQTISTRNTNASYWSDLGIKVFSETNSKANVEENGYYDRLIMDCVFKGPLASHKPNLSEGCGEFYNKLTSNGLCQSFNGIETSQVWKENKRKTEILQTFSKVFGESQQNPKQFRGTGHSEGMQK